eukprot:TRINITY_DN5563_c0_g1_i1.p1 TRINITY_DN5563_c0_g1~~TRINITY_DN5563_c0_g1_i1.p1  ORF type:complete len:688 (+),score=111.04 TRINITY_DN5563_c0_g1_i1:309-2066(+)
MWSKTYSCPRLYEIMLNNKDSWGSAEEKQLVARTLQEFRKNGMEIKNEGDRTDYNKLHNRITDIELECEQNINENITNVPFTKEELKGVPEDVIASLPTDPATGKLLASTKAPVKLPIMESAVYRETRKKMYTVASEICSAVNGPLINELVYTRFNAAKLAGYSCHADKVLSAKTATNFSTAMSFCTDILDKLRDSHTQQIAELSKEAGHDIASWDIRFYTEKLKSKSRGFDSSSLKVHFPLKPTLKKVLAVYNDLLNVSVEEDPSMQKWADDVMTYKLYVFNDAGEKVLKGYFYLDLFPRDGKYSHQMILPLAPCFEECIPACCFVGNLPKPHPGAADSYLLLDEVRTMFHELGHVMHCLLTTTKYSILSWSWDMVPWPGGVEQDFLEVPSTMFEKWMLCPEVVEKVASPDPKTNQTIPLDKVILLNEKRNEYEIVSHLGRYFAMAIVDLRLHSENITKATDAQKVFIDTVKEFTGLQLPPSCNPPASWYHILRGYDAGYYGYGWADAYAQDLFVSFKKSGVLDKETGSKLRSCILAPGATQNAPDMLQAFLGRPANSEAYLIEIGACEDPDTDKPQVKRPKKE